MSGERDAAVAALETRRRAGLFALPARGMVEVAGEDRVRWLDGMLSRDVTKLAPGPVGSGCHALALTRKGGIVADLHVWLRPSALWLEADSSAIPGLLLHLSGLVVADDVRLAEATAAWKLLALEGPVAQPILERASGSRVALEADAVGDVEIAGTALVVAAYGASGERAFRVAVPAERAEQVADSLSSAGAALGLVLGSTEAYEILRIEAGAPRFGAELGPDVLPAEARLESAIAFDKGCYTGQEIVARVESRGRVRRRLAGFELDCGPAPAPGDEIEVGGAAVGSITSGCSSPRLGAIGLGFVRIPHDAPGSEVRVGGRAARVAALPFAAPRDAEVRRGEV